MTIDYSALADGITSQLTAAMPEVLTITGVIMAISVGIKLFKRFAK